MEWNVGFSALEMIVATLEYHRVCTGWMLTKLKAENSGRDREVDNFSLATC